MALPSSQTSVEFMVHRHQPELITPANPTPYEFKPLSDFDDQDSLRFQIPIIHIYRNNPSMQTKDPVNVIREALAKTLVFYYPFAGRLREGPNRKLIVECTGEGILFIEADADITLDQCGDTLLPPVPCLEELLFDVPDSSEVLNCPLLLIQVTRFKCGGFTFAVRLNHTMGDGFGIGQFISTVGEMARGDQNPSIFPVWERHMLSARIPPHITCIHREYDEVVDAKRNIPFPLDNIVDGAFFIKFSELSALRRLVSPGLRNSCSSFELLSACLWKCRTIALKPKPYQEIRFIALNNARKKFDPPLLPDGYYGNGFVLSTAVATAKQISQNSIDFVIELIKKAKNDASREYFQSVADLMVIKGRPSLYADRTYLVSDVRHVGFREVDFGWGKPVFGGVARARPMVASFYEVCENKKGENGIVFPICLPVQTMKIFEKELMSLLHDGLDD